MAHGHYKPDLDVFKVIWGKVVLLSKHGHLESIGYTDSKFIDSKMNRKSTFAHLVFIEGNLVH